MSLVKLKETNNLQILACDGAFEILCNVSSIISSSHAPVSVSKLLFFWQSWNKVTSVQFNQM